MDPTAGCPKRDDLVLNEQHIVAPGLLAQPGNEFLARGPKTGAVGHRIEQPTRDLAGMPLKRASERLAVLGWQSNDLAGNARRDSAHRGLHCRVVAPVIRALEPDNARTSGGTSRKPDRHHHGLASGVRKSPLSGRRDAIA